MGLAVNEGKTKYMLSKVETCGISILRLLPIIIRLRQSTNLLTLGPPLPPKMMSV